MSADLAAGHRFNAARAAALAGCGCGEDVAGLSEEKRAHLRQQARDWLRLDLAAWTKRLESAPPAERVGIRKALRHWRDDLDLAGLREPGALEKLPTAERQECQTLWSDLEARFHSGP